MITIADMGILKSNLSKYGCSFRMESVFEKLFTQVLKSAYSIYTLLC